MSTSVSDSPVRRTGLAAAAAAALIAVGMPLALAVPTAAPPSDSEGYVNSTARCTSPDTAVLFGTTRSSRIAICKTPGGVFQYRGVRVSDGARLIAPAKQTSASAFVVDNNGVKYTITSTALSVTAGGNTFRTETWTDFHGPQAPATSAPSATPGSTSTSEPGTSATTSPSTPATGSTAAPTSTAAPSPAVPLPPPLPAEAGGGSSGE